MNSTEALDRLHAIDSEHRHLSQVSAVLQWDQETYMPEAAVEDRANQLALLERLAHETLCSPEMTGLFDSLGVNSDNHSGDEKLPALDRAFLRVFYKKYTLSTALPADLVSAAAKAEGLSQAAWIKARKHNNFLEFAPHLQTMLDFAKKKAEFWGFHDNPYDAHLDIHEPGMTSDAISAVFNPLKQELHSLLSRIADKEAPDCSFLSKQFAVPEQARFSRLLLEKLRYDTDRGRLDISTHPFTTTLGDNDVRITTRFFDNNPMSGIFSTIHETGHALYELGFAPELRSTSLADGASMGIHESQSRLWENVIGRSLPFWNAMYPLLQDLFPHQLGAVTLEKFYNAVNMVSPSLIRVDADEVSYSLHVILRFELEKQLFNGSLSVAELPDAWRRYMKELLGVVPDSDADGVLQDVHWSMGAFGYFPSYALGNIYGLQIWEKLCMEVGDTDELIRTGNFAPILQWLCVHVHSKGCSVTPEQLIQESCGNSISIQPFIQYLEKKYARIYSL